MSLKVGLLGFGKTGSLVAKEIVEEPGVNLTWVLRKNIPQNFTFASHSLGYDDNFAPFVTRDQFTREYLEKNPVDLIIDFSNSISAELYDLFADYKIKIISAISKYDDKHIKLIEAASKKTAIIASPNITLGINWLIVASKILKKIIPHADIEVVEEHFKSKPETSGTALKIAESLDIDKTQHINSIRVGGIVGRHEVIFGLPHQTIRLSHESISRSAFGTGALFAGKWLLNKENGLYKMEQVIHEKFVKHLSNMAI